MSRLTSSLSEKIGTKSSEKGDDARSLKEPDGTRILTTCMYDKIFYTSITSRMYFC